ncbi:MAG: DUF4384 domain-containing protein [Spirochaetes bacterium]|nr:DUF4384 domain-containing protein [Spirochaetota bacterium]
MKYRLLLWLFLFVISIGLLLILPEVIIADTQNDDSLSSFKWAFIHQKKSGDIEVLDFSKTVTVFSGDRLRIFIQPIQNVFIYIYFYDSQKQLSLLFPESFKDFKKSYKSGKSYLMPGEEDWFMLDDNAGIETFYLLASEKRLIDLERLTMDYLKASEKKKEMLKFNVLSEIKTVKKNFSKFKTVAEKPVPIAGSARGINENIEGKAYQVEARQFYGKTLRLEHR